MDLIEKLKERQGGKTQAEFATELGITQGTLSRIYSGDRGIGPDAARKIGDRCPELQSDLVLFTLGFDMPLAHSEIPA